MTTDIPNDMLYGPSPQATVKKPGDFRRRGPDGPPWVASADKTRKPKGNKPELLDKARAAGHDLPDKITKPELEKLLGPEPADELYGRPSAFGEMLDNPYNLIRWKERKLVEGLFKVLDLQFTDFDFDFSTVDGLIARAYEAADHMLAADRGTHIHLIVEHVLRGQAWGHLIGDGEKLGIPAPLQVHIAESYVEFRQALGVRSIAVELAIVNDNWKVAGTLDCLDEPSRGPIFTEFGTIWPDHAFIADVKTGGLKDADDTPSWWIKYGPQVCAYADGVPYDVDREVRLEWPATPHPDVALIYHYDLARALDGEPVAWQAIPVNLAAARAGGEIVKAAQQWAKRTDLFAPPITIEGAQPCTTTSPTTTATASSSTTATPTPAPTSTPSTTSSPQPSSLTGTGWRSEQARTTSTPTPACSRDALRARIGELIAAGHEALIRAHWPHGVAPLSQPGHTADDLALILTAVRRVESDVSWPFRPDDGTVATPTRPDPEDMPSASPAVTDESPPRPAPQLPDVGGDVDPATVAALQAAFAALPDAARQAIGVISAEANAAGRPISVTQSPTLRRWSIARALVAWAEYIGDGKAYIWIMAPDGLWDAVGQILDSSQVTDDDTTLGALIGALTIEQANALHDTFDITVAA